MNQPSSSRAQTPISPKIREITPRWIDIESDRSAATDELKKRNLSPFLIDAALAPGGIPRIEIEGDVILVLLRVFDEEADKRAATARDMTRKLGIFIFPDRIITVHRFAGLLKAPADLAVCENRETLFTYIVNQLIDTYASALDRSEDTFDTLEENVFLPNGKSFRLTEAYYLKRRLNILRKMLQLTNETLEALATAPQWNPTRKSTLRKRVQRTLESIDFFLEGINHLLQLHIALISQKTNEASQRTNEVMRVLTVFSAFFLPLSFIAGVYGMNFQHMPELALPHGYFYVLGLMAAVSLVIWLWFRKHGWMGNPSEPKPKRTSR